MNAKSSRIVLLSLALLAVVGVLTAGAQSGRTFFITDVDASSFPDVQFRMRATDLGNKVISGLSASDLTVYENGEEVTSVELTPNEDGPITYIFVIDLGRLSNYRSFGENRIRQVLSTLASGGYFKDGIDTVLVLGRRNDDSDQTVTLLPTTQSSSDLTTGVANMNLDRSPRSTMGLTGVEDAVRQSQELVPISGSQTTVIIFISRFIESPSNSVAPTTAQNVASLARQNNASIYVFQTDFNRSRSDTLQVLAEGSDGTYAAIDRSNFQSVATSIYQEIDSQRTYYTVNYRSPVAEPDERNITVNSPSKPAEGVVGTYEVDVAPPEVTITEPTPNTTIRREAAVMEEGGVPAFDLTSYQVAAEIQWPDGFPRNLQSAELLINGNPEDSVEVTPEQSSFDFEWDMSDITEEGTNLVTLQVNVQDELGLTADAENSVNVEVILPEEKSGLQLTPSMAAVGVPVLCMVGAAILVVLGTAIYLMQRGSDSKDELDEAEREIQATMFAAEAEDLALATLTVLEGPSGMQAELLRITSITTRLGRDPKQSEISFYADKQSSVSRSHASIRLDDDNQFRLTDNNSSAGTRLNGRPIPPDVAVVLDDGDEIVLGDLSQRGVKLRFNFVTSEGVEPLSGTADDRTHLLGDDELADWDDG